jgi:aminoglycoside phosphotransferase (APT) family kinase protein
MCSEGIRAEPLTARAARQYGRARKGSDLADLAALEARFGPLDPLGGGITNHNFRAGDVVVRLCGEGTAELGIDRDVERAATEVAAGLGIAPDVVDHGEGWLATRWVPGLPLESARRCVEQVARALRAFHGSGAVLATRFDVPALVRDYDARAGTEHAECAALADRIVAALDEDRVPCHNDLLPANLIYDGQELWIVDWEYAGMGLRWFDLGNLAVNSGFTEDEEGRLLAAYFAAPATVERRARLRLGRVLSDVREAMWGVVQGRLSSLDFDFAAYADEHFARLERAVNDPRFEGWMRDAAPS